MNLKHLSDESLLTKTQSLVKEEREILSMILHHLREIERRRLFSALKYSSLFEYAVKELKYSEDQAQRRISAMRLLRDLPESQRQVVEAKINQGSLSLTNMALAQKLFKAEKSLSKVEVLVALENKTTREAQKIVAEISPQMKKRGLELYQIEDEALRAKLIKVKGLMAHSHPDITLEELLHNLCDQVLEKSPCAPKVAGLKKRIWQRDQRCTNCGSQHALEVDHIWPKAKGGLDTETNLRLLCRSCNQRAAIEHYGRTKMARFLREPERAYVYSREGA